MLEIGGVIDPWCQQYNGRMGGLPRRHGHEVAVEDIRISCHRPDVIPGDEVGKDPLGDLPVLQHIAYAAGRAQVVLQDVKSSVLVADEVDPRDMYIDIVRNL